MLCMSGCSQAAAWRQYGNATLAFAHALTYLCCYGGESTNGEDLAVAMADVAQLLAEQQGRLQQGHRQSPASTAWRLTWVA